MLNGIKCEPCNGTGLTTAFDAQAIMRAMPHLQRGNLIYAVKALREYTSGEVSLKAAVDYARDVMTPELEVIERLQANEDAKQADSRANRQTDAYGGGSRKGHTYSRWGDEGKCDCEFTPCGVLGHRE